MMAVINGKDVKLYLDGKYGATVLFPFSPVIIHLGSYARANNDPAHTVFDNLRVDAVKTATLSLSALTMGVGQTAPITVRIPEGAIPWIDFPVFAANRSIKCSTKSGRSSARSRNAGIFSSITLRR